ncbi:MAG: hypothetical protein JW768_05610 [Chitinispirillaceae bacterium]|nr:hypothetical protein [Chitinispirillaceae bacterium]
MGKILFYLAIVSASAFSNNNDMSRISFNDNDAAFKELRLNAEPLFENKRHSTVDATLGRNSLNFCYNYDSIDMNHKDNCSKIISKPFLLSLTLSHGSGLYSLRLPEKAKKYLWGNILFFDIPIAILASSIIIHYQHPSFFQGTTLTITEYIVNLCVLSIPISFFTTRYFECRDVYKTMKAH